MGVVVPLDESKRRQGASIAPLVRLTREPMALCPFCQSDADWPADIVVVHLKRATAPVRKVAKKKR